MQSLHGVGTFTMSVGMPFIASVTIMAVTLSPEIFHIVGGSIR